MSLVNASELDTSPPEWTVGDSTGSTTGMIPGIGTGFVWGPRTAGKSLVFGIDLGLAIGNGASFLGYPTVKGKVVYCIGEGLYDLGLRKQARLAREERDRAIAITTCARDQGDEAARELAASFTPYTDNNLYVITEPFTVPLLNPSMEQTASLKKAITTIQRLNTPGPDDDPETFDYVQVVILDSLANFTGRSLSNDSSANLLVSGMQAMCRELECVILAIAHPTEKGDKMLGAGRLLNSADFEIEVRPDDNQAPGSLRTASVLNHKSKYSALFEPIGYQVEPCEWDEPRRDENDEIIPGETVRVRSATIRMLETDKPSSAPPPARQPSPPLPELRDVERKSRKRSGLRPHRSGLRLTSNQAPAPAAKPPAPLILGTLSVECPDCHALGGGMSCNPSVSGPADKVIPLSMDPLLCAHGARVLEAWGAGRISETDCDQLLALAFPAATPVPAPEPPAEEPAASEQDKRLWWTTVRPDKTGARA